MNFSTTILFSTYNQPEYLELTLKSILAQKVLPNEIVIADDGSGEPTKEMIEKYRKLSAIPIAHVWHEDDGFRKGEIMNKAVAAAKGDYIMQIDGDIVLGRHFVEDHTAIARPHTFCAGSRILLSEKLSKTLLRTKSIRVPLWLRMTVVNAYRWPLMMHFLAGRYKQKRRNEFGRGCNFAFWREDFIKVNGYNEDMVGWGYEDTELAVRMRNAGVGKQFLKFGGVAFHVWHKLNSRHNESKNKEILQNSDRMGLTRTEKGIDQYL